MGLDGVELIIEVEETFGIHIEDEEACNALTVGQFHELICRKYEIQEQSSCATSKAFYRLRQFFSSHLNICKKDIRPKTSLSEISQTTNTRLLWDLLKKETKFKLPYLERPRWLFALLVIITIFSSPMISYQITKFWKNDLQIGTWIILTLFMCLFLAILLSKLTSAFATVSPSEYSTVGSLSRQVVTLNAKQFAPLTNTEVWDILTEIVSECFGIEKETITTSTRFVEDLGC